MAREGRQPSFQGGGREAPAWGEGRQESRGPRREFQPATERPERPAYTERQPTAADQDSQWRTKMRPDAPSPTSTPDASTPSSPAPSAAAPASRPRLNLAKRTVSEAKPEAAAANTPSDKPNPFGAAKPIDTAAKEKEIEEKRQLELRQKKEADDKAREEKKAKDAEKAAAAKETASATPSEKSGKTEGAERPKANFDILQQEGEEGTAAGQDEDANGEIVDDKAVKPQETVRDPPKSAGAWRRKDDTKDNAKDGAPAAAEGTTTEQMDEDGWSTVSKPKKPQQSRRGGPPARAIAS